MTCVRADLREEDALEDQVADLAAERVRVAAVGSEGPARTEEEMGDLLFSIANLARKLGIDSESALRKANEKFTRRFEALEEGLHAKGSSVHGASLDEMEREWGVVKDAERSGDAASKH